MFGFDDVLTTAQGLGSSLGAIGTGVLNYLGTQNTNQQNADVAASNNAWSAQQYATRYQTMTKDMEAAGLNPMLAYSQSAGQAPTAQAVQFQNPVSSAVDAYNATTATRAKSHHDYASASQADSAADLNNTTIRRVGQEIENLSSEKDRIEAATKQLAASAKLMASQGQTEEARQQHLLEIVKNLRVERKITQAEYDAMATTHFVGRIARELKPISDIGSDWVGLKGMFDRNRGKETRETGTYYDRQGNPSGGYSRQRSER